MQTEGRRLFSTEEAVQQVLIMTIIMRDNKAHKSQNAGEKNGSPSSFVCGQEERMPVCVCGHHFVRFAKCSLVYVTLQITYVNMLFMQCKEINHAT